MNVTSFFYPFLTASITGSKILSLMEPDFPLIFTSLTLVNSTSFSGTEILLIYVTVQRLKLAHQSTWQPFLIYLKKWEKFLNQINIIIYFQITEICLSNVDFGSVQKVIDFFFLLYTCFRASI